jgi:glycosyltransferase involved in cell wall biosynthesis
MTGGRRVVHVVRSDAFAGVERYIVDTATELAMRGWDVTVIGGEARCMREALSDGVVHRAARTVAGVTRELIRVGPADVLHAHMTAAELPAAALRRGARFVVTRHFATQRGRSMPGRLAAGMIERRMDAQIAISRFVADATDSPCVVVHNGVRPSERPPTSREQTVAVLQRLEPEKDTATALHAWAVSELAGAGWRLVVYGHGSQEGRLRSLSAELGLEASVRFAGFVDDPRLALATAGLFLATAPAEPFGLAVVEAMAEGTPVVAADGGAHRETLGSDGLFFAAGDADACAAQLRAICADESARDRIGTAVQARQRTEFSVAAHVDRLEQVYAHDR